MARKKTTNPPLVKNASVVITRGMRRQLARKARCRQRVPELALIIGVDLARENQAVCFMHRQQVLGRSCCQTPVAHFDAIFAAADELCQTHQIKEQVWAMEPASHYWMLLAEQCESQGRPYVLVHPLTVARERESARYNREKTDPRDAELIATLASAAKIIETVLPRTATQATLQNLAYAYFYVRRLSAAARTALNHFWHRLLPEFFDCLSDVGGSTALAIAQALMPFSKLCQLTQDQWVAHVKAQAPGGRLQKKRIQQIYQAIVAAAQNPHRRAGEGMPWRLKQAAERRRLFATQKQQLREIILEHYAKMPEAIYLDSIPGSEPFYNALTHALIGDVTAYDDPRAVVKLAGAEINHFRSGDMSQPSHISHRGRVLLRTAAYQQARFLVKRNADFAQRFRHLRQTKKFSDNQCYMAIANSYLRILHAVTTKKQFYQTSSRKTS
jgi:transposase